MSLDSVMGEASNVSGGMSGDAFGASESVGTPASISEQGQTLAQPQQAPSFENMANGQSEANATGTTSTADTAQATGFTAEAYGFAMPEALAQDTALVSRIQDFCVSSQLSPQQAQAVLGFWQNEQNAAMEESLNYCEQSLKDRWQGAYEQRLEQARSTLKMLDARMDGRLMPLMQGPLGNSPVFAEMLSKLSDVVGETTMEAGGMGGTRGSYAGSQLMSTEDFLRQVVFK